MAKPSVVSYSYDVSLKIFEALTQPEWRAGLPLGGTVERGDIFGRVPNFVDENELFILLLKQNLHLI